MSPAASLSNIALISSSIWAASMIFRAKIQSSNHTESIPLPVKSSIHSENERRNSFTVGRTADPGYRPLPLACDKCSTEDKSETNNDIKNQCEVACASDVDEQPPLAATVSFSPFREKAWKQLDSTVNRLNIFKQHYRMRLEFKNRDVDIL
jgi:hypothetical protein